MSVKRTLGGLVLAVGLLMVLVGIAMPSTTTTTSQTCYDNPMGYGQECFESTYETSTNKYPILFFGFVLSIVGGAIVRGDSSDARDRGDPRRQRRPSERGSPERESADRRSTDRRAGERRSSGVDARSEGTAERGFAAQVREAKRNADDDR